MAEPTDDQMDELAQRCWVESRYSGRDGYDFDHRAFGRECARMTREARGVIVPAPPHPLERVALPPMPLPVVKHDKLGDLFDRFAMHSYAMRFLMDCEKAAADGVEGKAK
jgi:hypothetical protein